MFEGGNVMTENDNKRLIDVGERIYGLRKKRGLSQEALANELKVSSMTISRIENGTTSMNIILLLKLAAVLEVSVEEILQCSENPCAEICIGTLRAL